MKKIIATTILFSYFGLTFAQDCFKLSSEDSTIVEELRVERSFEKDDVIYPFKDMIVSGITISGHVHVLNNDFLVRVIVSDKAGDEHLLLESYDEIYNKSIDDFCDYGEETLLLNNVKPASIRIILRNATLNLTNIKCVPYKEQLDRNIQQRRNVQLKEQKEYKIARINDYNSRHGKLWVASETALSSARYADMKRILGMNDGCSTKGLEFYSGGLFEIGDFSNITPSRSAMTSDPYVDSFDWRNRHGKNWTTSVKNQERSGYCTAFAAASTIESMTFLSYNQIFPLDLSEQEIARCSPNNNNPWHGINPDSALTYIKEHGVCQEYDYPFVNDSNEICRSDEIDAHDTIRIIGYTPKQRADFDVIKWCVIHEGPQHSWIFINGTTNSFNHCMELVGYGKVTEGMTVNDFLDGDYHSLPTIIGPNDPRIGLTYWIFKNSWGSERPNGGYMYVLFDNSHRMYKNYAIAPPVLLSESLAREVVCEDADGDGYYFWGLGPRPPHCPSWAPSVPDGDDSDINYGEMDDYGHLVQLPCGETIDSHTSCTANQVLPCRLGIVNGGVLTISATVTMSEDSQIRVCEGGTLIVDGGTIQQAKLVLIPGSTVIIRNGGSINSAPGWPFMAPIGTFVNIESGEIN